MLGCSQTKLDHKGPLSAIDRYDGVNFRVLCKFLNENGWPAGLCVKVLSAKFGLIDITDLIEDYDQRMVEEQARKLKPRVSKSLKSLGRFHSAFINLGQDYLRALDDPSCRTLAKDIFDEPGGIGQKMKAMKAWLSGLHNKTSTMRGAKGKRPYLYFFPDWDDHVKEPFVGDLDDPPKKEREDVRSRNLWRQDDSVRRNAGEPCPDQYREGGAIEARSRRPRTC